MGRRLLLGLLLAFYLVAVSGCGKDEPVVKTEPVHKGRIPKVKGQ
jgi:hypothetical protein